MKQDTAPKVRPTQHLAMLREDTAEQAVLVPVVVCQMELHQAVKMLLTLNFQWVSVFAPFIKIKSVVFDV